MSANAIETLEAEVAAARTARHAAEAKCRAVYAKSRGAADPVNVAPLADAKAAGELVKVLTEKLRAARAAVTK